MKKSICLLAILIIGTAVLAAAPKKAIVEPEKTSNLETKATASASTKNAISAVALTSLGCPLFRLPLAGASLDLGLTANSPAPGTTNYALIIASDQPWFKVGNNVQAYWTPRVVLSSIAGTSSVTGALLLGGEYGFAPNLTIFGDITALTVTSAAATTWGVLTNNAQVYTGVRLYL